MANLWANFIIHSFKDCEVKIKPVDCRLKSWNGKCSLGLGDNLLTLYGELGEFKDIAEGILDEITRIKNEANEEINNARRKANL